MSPTTDCVSVALSSDLDDREDERLRLFANHFSELWANWDEVRPKGTVSLGFCLRSDGRVDANQALHISRFRLKGLLTGYRKFHSQKEPTNFLAICRIMGRRCQDAKFHSVLKKCKDSWKKPNTFIVGWHNNYSPDDFMDAYFNDAVFHAGGAKRLRLQEIQEKLTEKAILFGAYDIACSRLLAIRNVN